MIDHFNIIFLELKNNNPLFMHILEVGMVLDNHMVRDMIRNEEKVIVQLVFKS